MSELLERAQNRARILNAAAAWGACEDGYLIQNLVERIQALEDDLYEMRQSNRIAWQRRLPTEQTQPVTDAKGAIA